MAMTYSRLRRTGCLSEYLSWFLPQLYLLYKISHEMLKLVGLCTKKLHNEQASHEVRLQKLPSH